MTQQGTNAKAWPRVLLVAYEFPPRGGAGVQRPSKMVKVWGRAGVEIGVLCCPAEAATRDDTLLAALPDDLVRFDIDDPSPFHAIQRARQAGSNWWVDRALVALGLVARSACFPDVETTWGYGVRRLGVEAIRAFNPDVIVATGPPFTSFRVGAMLARELDRPLVLDYRDPWTASYLPPRYTDALSNWINPWLEKRALRQAAGISVAHRAVARYLRPMLSSLPKRDRPRPIWIPNGFDPDDFPKRLEFDQSKFVLSYLGTFYVGLRDPSRLFSALEELLEEGKLDPERFRFRIAGASEHIKQLYDPQSRLAEVVEIGPYVAHSEAVERLQKATVNLVFEGRTPGGNVHSPGKFYEVLYAQRPVLLLCPTGTTTHLGRRAGGCWISEPDDKDAIKAQLLELYSTWAGGAELARPDAERLRFYDRHHQARRLLCFLKTIVDERASKR